MNRLGDRGSWRLSLGLLVAFVFLLVAGRGIHQIALDSEPFVNGDEPSQLMTAIYGYDLLRLHPLDDPIGFTFAYYGHYPAIAPLHWPPLTHGLTGLLFLLTGPSFTAARAMILAMTLLTLLAFWRLGRTWLGAEEAVLAVLLLSGTPLLHHFSSAFMLEVPCLLWMILTVVTLGLYVRSARARHLWLCCACAVAAVLTKQQAVALLPVLLAGAAWGFRRSHWRSAVTYIAPALGLGVAGLYYAYARAQVSSGPDALWVDADRLLDHLFVLFREIGPLTLVLSLIGLVAVPWRDRHHWLIRVALIWIAAVLGLYLLVGASPRHLLYSIPPLCLLGARLGVRAGRRLSRRVRVGALGTLALAAVVQVGAIPPRQMHGFREAAIQVNDRSEHGAVVYDGTYEANFILYRRLDDPALCTVSYRTSRLIAGGSIFTRRHYTPFVRSPEDVRAAFLRTGAAWVVSEAERQGLTEEQRWFRAFLQGPEFEHVETFEVRLPRATGRRLSLHLYRYLHPVTPPELATVPMITLNREAIQFRPGRSLLDWSP